MKVKFSQLLNSGILDEEWIGFQGDSEYISESGEIQMGYWSFKNIIDKDYVSGIKKEYPTFNLNDEIDEEEIFNQELSFLIWNNKDSLCVVQFHYHYN